MHIHLQKQPCTSNCPTISRAIINKRDHFSPNLLKPAHNQLTRTNFSSQRKFNLRDLVVPNKQLTIVKQSKMIPIESQAKPQPQNTSIKNCHEHVSTAQSNESFKTIISGKEKWQEKELKARNKKLLQNAQEPKRQFKLINRIKQLRKLKLSNKNQKREILGLCQENTKNSAQTKGSHKTKENDKTTQQHTVSSINLSTNSNFTQDCQGFSSDFSQAMKQSYIWQLGLESKVSLGKTMKLSAVVEKVNTLDESILEKIRRHLSMIEQIHLFVQESMQYCYDQQQWKQLHFLLIKKYLLERIKVVQFLKKYPMKNPFVIQTCKISIKEVLNFMKNQQGHQFLRQLESKNKQIQRQLAESYDSFDKSMVGQKINLFLYDNVSQWIIDLLWIEFTLTQYSVDLEQQTLNRRLCRILQIIFLIVQINDRRLIPFESGSKAVEVKEYTKYINKGKSIFQNEVQYR